MKTVSQLPDDALATFFTDPHLGANRVANTTPKSRMALRQALYSQALACTEGTPPAFMLGDLFNSYSNSEDVLLQGLEVTRKCKATMAGNHDVHASADAVGSFQALIEAAGSDGLCWAAFGTTEVKSYSLKGAEVFMVPHVTDQGLFEQALRDAVALLKDPKANRAVLCLHCNYNLPWDTTDTALNLTEEAAQDLLNHFDYVLLGHDHHAKVEMDGRLIVLGNTHPTGFGDISDKYRYALLPDGSMVRQPIWQKGQQYDEVDVGGRTAGILHDWVRDNNAPQFIDIVGEVVADEVVELNRTVNKLWAAGALAIRNRVSVQGAEVEVSDTTLITSLAQQVEADLGDRPEQLALWRQLSEPASA